MGKDGIPQVRKTEQAVMEEARDRKGMINWGQVRDKKVEDKKAEIKGH